MAKIYYNRIIAGDIALDDVPERWKAEVEKLLNETTKSNENQ